MEIIRGKIATAKKVVVYGPEGIGKSTFASKFPDPIFIDTEGSTNSMDVARLPKASSWQMIMEQIQFIKNNKPCKTLVIDTIDWAEQMCISYICNKHQKNGVEDFGYGTGYVYVKEEFGRFLNKLSELVEQGTNVVLTAHAQIRKFEQPDEMGAYDRYELKLGKKTSSQTSPLVKEWADMLLFANYKTYSIAVDKDGKKHKAQGGQRVMYTLHHPCWDAKNRDNLPEELPFDFASIAHVITDGGASKTAPVETRQTPPEEPKEQTPPVEQVQQKKPEKSNPEPQKEATSEVHKDDEPVKEEQEEKQAEQPKEERKENPSINSKIPKQLRDLMEINHVSDWDIQNAVSAKGYFPADMAVEDYPEDFVDGVLVGAWDQVYGMIKEAKETQEIPFN